MIYGGCLRGSWRYEVLSEGFSAQCDDYTNRFDLAADEQIQKRGLDENHDLSPHGSEKSLLAGKVNAHLLTGM